MKYKKGEIYYSGKYKLSIRFKSLTPKYYGKNSRDVEYNEIECFSFYKYEGSIITGQDFVYLDEISNNEIDNDLEPASEEIIKLHVKKEIENGHPELSRRMKLEKLKWATQSM